MNSLSNLQTAMQRGPYGVSIAVNPDSVEVDRSHDLHHWQLLDVTGTAVADVYGKILSGHMGEGLSMEGATIHCNHALASTADLERHVVDDGLHGNWILITRKPLPRRLYTDYGCSLVVVYAPEQRRAGSSPLQVLGEERFQTKLNPGRIERLVRAEGEHGWISGTLTAHDGLSRLLPNHFLDLENFTAHRFWPREDFAFGMDFEEAAQICARDIRSFVEAAARQYKLGLSLTAGYDSRIVLSGGARVPELLHPYTFRLPGLNVDSVVPRELCRHLGLSHRYIEIVQSDEAGKAWWDRMVGYSVREVNRNIFPTLLGVDAEMTLSGIYGETGRIRFYRKDVSTINSQSIKLESLLWRMSLPRDPELLDNLAGWLEPIAHLPTSVILDLAFVELKIGSWAIGQSPAQKVFSAVMMPLAQRRLQGAMMSVEPTVRGNGPLFHRIGEINWPKAMEIPVNSFGDHRDFLAKVGAVRTVEKVRRFLRQKLG